ncbi:hypothetical protein AVEN_174321-1, partial [Araneus ventricosus]
NDDGLYRFLLMKEESSLPPPIRPRAETDWKFCSSSFPADSPVDPVKGSRCSGRSLTSHPVLDFPSSEVESNGCVTPACSGTCVQVIDA